MNELLFLPVFNAICIKATYLKCECVFACIYVCACAGCPGHTDGGQLSEVQAGAGLAQQVQPVVEQLGARGCVQVLQLLDGDLRLNIHDAQDERRVLYLQSGRHTTSG